MFEKKNKEQKFEQKFEALPAYLPRMEQCEVILDVGPKVTEARGINPSQFLALIDP